MKCCFMTILRSKLPIISFILLFGGALFLLNGHWQLQDPGFQEQDFLFKKARHPLVVHGFQFSGYHQRENNISITAVRHSIEKKKLGHFTAGSLRIAKFKGAEIDVRIKPVESPKNFEADSQKSSYSLKGSFTREAMPASHLNNLVSYIFEPVIINFHDGRTLITQIRANSATIESRDRRVVFRGNVLAKSGSRRLATDKLTLFPEGGMLKTDRHFVLNIPEKQFAGENLTTDLSLYLISVQAFPK